jgi:GNAT superfamily N-acetyltransferase
MLTLDEPLVLHEDASAGIRIVAAGDFSDAYVAHIEETLFGTEGLRYRRLGVREQLNRLPRGVFVELHVAGSLTGTYMIAGSGLDGGPAGTAGLYRGLLSVRPEARGAGLGRQLVRHTFNWLESRARDSGRPAVSWGCIERANLRSMRVLESLGARPLGSLESLTTYQQWPREKTAVDELDESSAADIQAALASTFADCGLRLPAGDAGDYFALTSGSTLVAGARATLTRVDMASSGSAWDWIYRYLVRHVPAARRRFDPQNFTYLRLSDIVIREGHEQRWKELLGAIKARHGVHMAMFMLDPRARARQLLERAGVFGRLTASTRQEVVVLANAWNTSPDVLRDAAAKPLGIGPLDL